MKTRLIIGNWKMHKTVSETIRLITELKNLLSGKQETEIVVAPSYVALHPAEIAAQGTPIKMAAQNMFYEETGAFTGEVSPSMLVDVGCTYVLLGHSERRQNFGETNAIVNRKAHAAVENQLRPVVCVGETKEERQKGLTFEVIETQLRECLRGLSDAEAEDLVIAYEPVWAIGTGDTASPGVAQEVHHFISDKLSGIFRRDVAQKIRIIYGGSVTPENIRDLMAQPEIDGALVGTASLDARSFVNIVHYEE